MISTSSTWVLPVVLCACHTTEMTFLTSSHLYSPYADLTQNSETVLLQNSAVPIAAPIEVQKSVVAWERPCGVACPELEHSWFRSDSIGHVVWNRATVDEEASLQHIEQPFFWKMKGKCKNVRCNHYYKHFD